MQTVWPRCRHPAKIALLVALALVGPSGALAQGSQAPGAGASAAPGPRTHSIAQWARILAVTAEEMRLDFTSITLDVTPSSASGELEVAVQVVARGRFYQLAGMTGFKKGDAVMRQISEPGGRVLRAATFALAMPPDSQAAPARSGVAQGGAAGTAEPAPAPGAGALEPTQAAAATGAWIAGLALRSAPPDRVSAAHERNGAGLALTYGTLLPGLTRVAIALGEIDPAPGPRADRIVLTAIPSGVDLEVTAHVPFVPAAGAGKVPDVARLASPGVGVKPSGTHCTLQGTVPALQDLSSLLGRALKLPGLAAVSAFRATRRGDGFDVLGELRF